MRVLKNTMKYKLIIFDCDGVLVDSEPVSNKLFADMVNGLGLNLSNEESAQLFTGRSDDDCIKIIEERLKQKVRNDFIDDFNNRLILELEKSLNMVKNIDKVLSFLSDTAICVASNAPAMKVKHSLKITGLDIYFNNNIFTVENVNRGKPYPDIYLYAAKQMGFEPEECAVVEDSVFGVRAGVAAGMDVYGYTERIDKEILKKECAVIFNSMLDLPILFTEKIIS